MLRRRTPPEPPTDNEDAFLALTTIGPWVNNADTAIGLLAAALTVLTAGAVRQRPRVEALPAAGFHIRGASALASLVVCAVADIAAGVWLFRALRPRLTDAAPSRFAFPYPSTVDVTTLVDPDPMAVRREAWMQAHTLSEIVDCKYRCSRSALSAGRVAGIAFVAWLVLVPL